jgi:hypothetical protein
MMSNEALGKPLFSFTVAYRNGLWCNQAATYGEGKPFFGSKNVVAIRK